MQYKPKCFFVSALVFFLFLISSVSFPQTETINDGKYIYSIVKNDPFKARIYKLDNGLTVYLTVYKDKPRIQTVIGVRAGSKNDPRDATGLAHYLEHLLFKGTDKFGTTDFSQEEIFLNQITQLFEVYKITEDTDQRKEIYRQIDSLSQIASSFAISNEYDKMMTLIGAKGTNAMTSFEETIYVEDIPSNQLLRWITIEAERFRNPVFRLFHTELETVYEEKNMSLDRDDDKADEMFFSNLFQNHPYGTQTTIGTIEHLKNPSIKKVYDFFHTYYVPNNMCVCLSGDFDMDETIKLIDEKFGGFRSKDVPEFIPPSEEPFTTNVVKEVLGQESEFLYMGFRFKGIEDKESKMLDLIGSILYNGSAGLFDLNLTQKQKVLSAYCFPYLLNDYSVLYLYGKPREGQTLEEVKDLILSQIELVKKGEFPDWMLKAIITNKKLRITKVLEDNSSRAYFMMNSFSKGISWQDAVNSIDNLSMITREEIIKFANEYFKDNYVVVYKRKGEDKNVQKIEKPGITPVTLNTKDKSEFFKNVSEEKIQEIKPVFLDFKKDIQKFTLKEKLPVYYLKNNENNTFNLYYVWEMGNNSDNKIGLAVNYLQYLGTSKYSLNQIKQELYKLGCNFGVSASKERVYVNIGGISENLESALSLFESLLDDPQPDETALKNLVNDILKVRADNKLSQDAIFSALYSYAVYGPESPGTNILSEAELKAVKSSELIDIIRNLKLYKHKILYYGSDESTPVIDYLGKYHNIPVNLKDPIPEKKFSELPTTENNIYFVNYKDMQQVEIMTITRKGKFNLSEFPIIKLYNEYFGYTVVFQELREARGLAYSTYANYTLPSRKEDYHYMTSYIGTQADKIQEALEGLLGLLNNMPLNEILFSASKNNLTQRLQTDRTTKANILFNFLSLEILGIDHDTRIDMYDKIPGISLKNLEQFHNSNVKDNKYSIIIIGDKEKVDFKSLEKYGKIYYLALEQVFGY